MDKSTIKAQEKKCKRALRVRKHVRGDSQKPRMCVVKSNKHIQVQIIDDAKGSTLASISTNSKAFKNTDFCKKNKVTAKVLGEKIAEQARGLGIVQVVFDRGPFKYHGILTELACAARAGGLQF